jgi:alcohol dehydrogenase, propanol-preferring
MTSPRPATMLAYRLTGWQQPAAFAELDVPRPGPGEVLVKVAGVGLCHTDIHFLEAPPGYFPYELPMTLGHEIAGWVEELGTGVDDVKVGDSVVVKSRNSCGLCRNCRLGHDNYCRVYPIGLGAGLDGGLSNYVAVPRRCLVPLTSLDPRQAGPLADAGCTPYHAVKKVLPKLSPGSTAIVIGTGGLGGYAVQYLKLLSACRVIAVDTAQHRLDALAGLGVEETVLADASVASTLAELTDGDGATAVFDFVGTDATMGTALASAATLGTVVFVGAGGGSVPIGWNLMPLECEVFIPMGGSLDDLYEVVALAEAGKLRMDNELFAFDDLPAAYERVRTGNLRGRAVVTPNG